MNKAIKSEFDQTKDTAGSYVFKVKFKAGVWRKIQISKTATLDRLNKIILTAYDFDDDHLYAFFMNNKAWSYSDSYWSPNNDEGPYANKKKLVSLNLEKGKKFMYLFDFGDEWRFTISLEKETNDVTKEPVIIQSKGEAPLQYPDYDDEEEYE